MQKIVAVVVLLLFVAVPVLAAGYRYAEGEER